MTAAKYIEMVRSGKTSAEVGAQMKADGLATPLERGNMWDLIKAAMPAPAPAAKKVAPVCKFKAAAIALLPSMGGKNGEKFVAEVAAGIPSLSVKQKAWLKALCDENGIALEYKPRAAAVKAAPRFTNPQCPPYDHMDLPIWDAKKGEWYDAEY